MTRKYWSFVLFLLFSACFAFAQGYEAMRIAKIDINVQNTPAGVDPNTNAIRAKLSSKVGNFFSQAEFDNDLKALAADFARVEPNVQTVNNEIYITLNLWMKPKIRSLEFEGNEHLSLRKLKKTLEIEEDTVFDQEEFIQAFNKLKSLYVKKGYFEAELEYVIIPVENENQVDILIKICEGRSGKIKHISFQGLTPDEEDEILDLIATRRYNLLLSWYTGKGTYHTEMIEHDKLEILNYLQDQGYADAFVDICIEESESENRIDIVITIDKGIRYYFGEVCFFGNTLYSNEEIWAQIQFRPGDIYSPGKIRASVKALNDLYGGCGYIDVGIDAQLSLRADGPVYDTTITIDEGQQYYIGLIKVFGNCITQTKVILNETLLCPGDVFDLRKLEATEIRLGNTGYFNCVNVYAARSQLVDPCGRNYRDVYIEVQEGDTGNLGLFFGFSSIDRIFGGLEITERNFNIAGVPHLFDRGPRALRGGGEFLNAKANFGQKVTNYTLAWSKPYFLDTPWILSAEVEKTSNRALSKGYAVKTYGGSIHNTYIQNIFLKYDIHYRIRHTRVDVRDKNNPNINDEQGTRPGLISAAGFSLIYDSTDHPRRPSHGFRSRFLYEVAGLGGDFRFMKFAYINALYYPLSERGTLKFRADFQFIKTFSTTSADDLPLSERFFLGGETTVRGYRPYIIGPKFGNNEPKGGVSSMLLSEEYQYNLLECPCVDAFVFVDAGYVSLSEFSLGRPAVSVGFGLRFELIRNMPIMVGMGWPIHPSERLNGRNINNAERFFFALGGCF